MILWRDTEMSYYFNPGKDGFETILRSEYVDKTGMLALINAQINTSEKLICFSRARRFG